MNTLSLEEKRRLEDLFNSFKVNENILKMKDIPMHRGSNCYIHSFRVAKLAIKKASKRKGYNLENILIAAILHDYYLYDWRTNKALKKKHGKRHPIVANENAKKDFNISKEISEIILSHMWPLTPRFFPKTKDARLVNSCDNIIATKEMFTSIAFKKKRMESYYSNISVLFDEKQ